MGSTVSHGPHFTATRESQSLYHSAWKVSGYFLYCEQHMEIIVQLLLINQLKIPVWERGNCFLSITKLSRLPKPMGTMNDVLNDEKQVVLLPGLCSYH